MPRSTIGKLLIPALTVLTILAFVFLWRQNSGSHKLVLRSQTVADKSLGEFYKQAQQLAPQTPQTASTTFLAVGDIMLSRNVAATIKAANDPSLPFHPTAPLFQSVDFSFGNLETPVTSGKGIIGGHSLVFSSPKEYVAKLKDYNFKILNLANNHAFDQGLNGLIYTSKTLDENNIKHVGTGNNLDEAWQPAIIESNGIKICFIGASYASANDSGKTTNNYVARIKDVDRLKSSVATAKSECDFTVVTMHAGTEYTRKPNQAQIDFAHAAIDDGADIVIGAHPHWVQTVEQYQGKYIFYSLGNFIFDQMWSQDTKEGLTLKITISKTGCAPSPPLGEMSRPMAGQRGCADDLQGPRTPAHLDSIELLPVIIENYSTPRPATADESKKILEKIGQKENILK